MMDPKSLEEKIKENPLDNETILFFFKEKVISVHNNYPKKSAHIVKDGLTDTYSITIGSLYPRDEQEIALIHEACHAIYGAMGWLSTLRIADKNEVEHLVEKEAKRFYEENINFVKDLYSKLIDHKLDPKDLQ